MCEVGKELTGDILLQAANQAAKMLIINHSMVDPSLVQRWRERQGIHILPHGEEADCPDFTEWLNMIQVILEKYDYKDIYNMEGQYDGIKTNTMIKMLPRIPHQASSLVNKVSYDL